MTADPKTFSDDMLSGLLRIAQAKLDTATRELEVAQAKQRAYQAEADALKMEQARRQHIQERERQSLIGKRVRHRTGLVGTVRGVGYDGYLGVSTRSHQSLDWWKPEDVIFV